LGSRSVGPPRRIAGVTSVGAIGLTPGLVGLYQINVVVPPESPKGDVPIRVQLDTTTSEYALIAVE